MLKNNHSVDYVLDQLNFLPDLRAKSMFGGFGLYTENIYFALICDNMLFYKTKPLLVDLIGDDKIRAYPGSKNSLHIPEEFLEHRDKIKEITLKYFQN
jgi:hypothetical protein